MKTTSIKVANPTISEGVKKRFLIISDTHISNSESDFNLIAFKKGIEQINKLKNIDYIIHLGDLTQNGTLNEFEYAKTLMSEIKQKVPVQYVIGNHDALNVGYLLFEEMIGERHFEIEDENFFLLALDSTIPDLATGKINYRTMMRVKNLLLDRPNKMKVVCFHHQLIPIPHTGKERSAILDSGDMLQVLKECGVHLVLNGHRHISNLYTINFGNHDLLAFNSGTFSSNKTRYRENFTYNIIDLNNDIFRFNIIPILQQEKFKKEIFRKVSTYSLRKKKKDEKPFCKIIHFFDSSLSPDDKKTEQTFNKLIQKINNQNDISIVLHSGNVTKNSYKEEYEFARERLKEITYPYIVVPGINDVKPNGYQLWLKNIGDLDSTYEDDKLVVLALDTTTFNSKFGRIGRRRIKEISEQTMKKSREKVICVLCHHEIIPTPMSVWKTELVDAGDVLSRFSLSQIALILTSSSGLSLNTKIDNSIFSSVSSLKKDYFNEVFVEIDLYRDGLVELYENDLTENKITNIGRYSINLFT